ncbi:MAG TPA: acyltransferase [Kineosporiaceae bacterium]|nr:acyltransferase [Kineosporiaceae bacterium]
MSTVPERGLRGRAEVLTGSLGERFDPRRNHLGTIRLVLALVVAVTHAMELGFAHQPGIGGAFLSDLAVDAFFVLSGFLLAGSYLRLESVRRYAWHRFLRIMPAFWVCLLVIALVVAPLIAWLQGRAALSVFTGPQSAVDFLRANAFLPIRQFGIAGLPVDVLQAGVLNGSLWTLFYEALCYTFVIVLGLLGALRRRPAMALAVVGLLWAVTALNTFGPQIISQERFLRLTFMFLIGSVMSLYAGRIPMRSGLAAASVALVLAALVWLPDYRAVAAPAFGYLCLWLTVVRPPATNLRSDYSYGLYVYHWPILQILAVTDTMRLTEPVFVLLGVILAFGAAVLSWVWVERPALRFKDAAWVTRDRLMAPSPDQPTQTSGRLVRPVRPVRVMGSQELLDPRRPPRTEPEREA